MTHPLRPFFLFALRSPGRGATKPAITWPGTTGGATWHAA